MGRKSGLPPANESTAVKVGGLNTMNYPIDDFLGGRMGGSTSQVDGVTTNQHRIIVILVLAAVALFLWHWSQTH